MSLDGFLQLLYALVGAGAAGFVAYNVVKTLFPDQAALEAQARLGVESAARNYRHWSLTILAPFVRLILPRIQQIKMPLYRQEKKQMFITAGVDDQFTPDEFVGFKIFSSLLSLIAAGLFSLQMEEGLGPTTFATALVVGFFIPDFAVWDIKRKRQKAILRELPTMMDLLTLSVEAGLDFMAAISRVVSYAKPGPLKEEFGQMLNELQIGTVRSDALRNLADRVRIPELSSFASILIQADQMGSSIGPVLRAQSDQLRQQRFQRAERAGASATQRLLIPLVTCIMPAVFIVILGPWICDVVYNQTWFNSLFGGGSP